VSAIDLIQFNVWLDVVFTTLYTVVLIALGFHFLGNILSGRFKKKFIRWQGWPHHDGPPIPTLPKFLHFQHMMAMILLAISGLYIRFPGFVPLWSNGRTFMRWVHYVAMIVVVINLIWRLWYAFASSRRDYREFAITKKDIASAPQVILYYIFVKKSKPHLGKYNIMQKATYISFVPLLLIQAFTGFALVTAPLIAGTSPRDWLVGWWLGSLVGSVDLAGWYMRMIHYIINWLFILLTTIHVYLSMTEDFPAFLNFFGLGGVEENIQERKDKKYGTQHEGGHGDEHGGESDKPQHAPEPAL
jgi:Ni/Fe-hydrogenase 1 B-type cytochrome subunit